MILTDRQAELLTQFKKLTDQGLRPNEAIAKLCQKLGIKKDIISSELLTILSHILDKYKI